MKSQILSAFQDTRKLLDEFIASSKNIDLVNEIAEMIAKTIRSGNKVLSCGNGGSMCDAMHFAEELTGRFRGNRNSLPAIAISDPSHITCAGNDYGFESIFSRFVEGVGNHGDLLLGISTSGNSPNIIKAIEAAKEKGMYTIALLGKDGGKIKDLADLSLVVPAKTSDRIQEMHIKIIHISIEMVEKILDLA
ncbi:D-sedoheptulose 7-phosphate isomerase [bacterium]|nr:D-sedoheptulose 7-phosphate isomerase [bacterium]